ncbi:hypothetical protein [Rhizobium leguminosarum]|uniref:hypothetical protein n=1 Tax=Rhizobium leguminosarum TaxID=384 RepID=UPI001441DDAE|nr:hypothetical protein [Rhizobium leguminosarum]
MTAPTSAIATTAPIHAPYKLCPRMTPARTGVTMSVTTTGGYVAATVSAKNGEGEGGDIGCGFGQASLILHSCGDH